MSRSTFFSTFNINYYQEEAIKQFAQKGLKVNHFAGRQWFNSHDHIQALKFLLNKQQKSIDEALSYLEGTTAAQAWGLTQGLTLDEMKDLTHDQIHGMVEFGFTRDELAGVENSVQIAALYDLKTLGLKTEHLQGQDWFKDERYVTALIYFVTIKKMTIEDALAYLRPLNKHQALAASYGYELSQLAGLEKPAIKVLIEKQRYAGISAVGNENQADVPYGLSETQIETVRVLYRFGLTCALAKETPDDEKILGALITLVGQRGIPLASAMQLLKGLDETRALGLETRLTLEEMDGLNDAQVTALKAKTTRNGITAELLRGKDWFNDDNHRVAFINLVNGHFFSATEAMAELEGLDASQVRDVGQRYRTRDDLVGLTPMQLKAVANHDFYAWGLRGHMLRGKEWFNSDSHLVALSRLQPHRVAGIDSMVQAIAELEGFNAAQAELRWHFSRKEILAMSPVQVEILTHTDHYSLHDDLALVAEATWITKQEQAALFGLLMENCYRSTHGSLALLEQISDRGEVIDLINKIRAKEISQDELRKMSDEAVMKPKQEEQPAQADYSWTPKNPLCPLM